MVNLKKKYIRLLKEILFSVMLKKRGHTEHNENINMHDVDERWERENMTNE